MLSTFFVSTLLAGAAAQNGFQDIIGDGVDKVKAILSGAADICENSFVSGNLLENLFCGSLIPQPVLDFVNINTGYDSVWCKALACAYRGAGCRVPYYRVEAGIIMKTGVAHQCIDSVPFLDAEHCNTLLKYIDDLPNQPPLSGDLPPPGQNSQGGRKREEPTPSKADIAAAEAEWAAAKKHVVTEEEMLEGRILLSHALPEQAALTNNFGAGAAFEQSRKRQGTLEALKDQAKVCSTLMATVIGLLHEQFKEQVPLDISSWFGPCGKVCGYAVCAYNMLCGANGVALVTRNQALRVAGGCTAPGQELKCGHWAEAPENKCKDVQCNPAVGMFEEGTLSRTGTGPNSCAPPKRYVPPTRADENNCCETCIDTCAQFPCPPGQIKCPEPAWPRCAPYSVGRYDEYSCCDTCNDACAAQAALEAAGMPGSCGPPAQNCPAGTLPGPRSPNDCCLTCVQPCQAVACPIDDRLGRAIQTAADCPAGTKFKARLSPEEIIGKPDGARRCYDCCNECVGKPIVQQTMPSAASAVAPLFALVAALAAFSASF